MKRSSSPVLDTRLHLNVTAPLNTALAMAAQRKLISLRQLRVQHAALHMALPELQAVGDDPSDPDFRAGKRAVLTDPVARRNFLKSRD